MTTKNSPLRVLKHQADTVAKLLKAVERGDPVGPEAAKMVEARRTKPDVQFAVVMDDKTLVMVMTWEQIAETPEVGLSEYVLREMREQRAKPN